MWFETLKKVVVFFSALCFLIVLLVVPTQANTNTPYKIVMVLWRGETDAEKGFKNYLDSQQISYELTVFNCNLDRQKCHQYVKQIKTLKPDLIYIWGTTATEEIAGRIDQNKDDYIWDIPIVAIFVTDPTALKIIHSIEKPGRNVTGVNNLAAIEAQLNAMLMYKANTKRIAAVFSAFESNARLEAEKLKEAALKKGIHVIFFPMTVADFLSKTETVQHIFRQISKENVDFIYVGPDSLITSHTNTVLDIAYEYCLPVFSSSPFLYSENQKKPLVGLVGKSIHIGECAGKKAEQILIEGQDPAEMPYKNVSRLSYLISKSAYTSLRLFPPVKLFQLAEIIP